MTVAEYFDQVPEERIETLLLIREHILQEYPGIEETMEYKMPTYVMRSEPLFALASQKHHMALYIIPYQRIDAFRDALSIFDLGKSCIRFKKMDDNKWELLQKIITVVGSGEHSY